jgi:hypothetical protein
MVAIKDTKPDSLGYYDVRKHDYVVWW